MRWLKQLCCSRQHVISRSHGGTISARTVPQLPSIVSYCSGSPDPQGKYSIGRDWLVKLWREEKIKRVTSKRTQVNSRNVRTGNGVVEPSLFQLPFVKAFLTREAPVEEGRRKAAARQPPVSQYAGGYPSPTSSQEVKLAPLLARANLLITRDIEWANIMFAFEQENRYAIVDACYPGSPVGHIREQSNIIFRQLLRSRRPFIARITDAMGNEIFRVRRPFWLINSTIYAEVDGEEVGVVHRRWHLWR